MVLGLFKSIMVLLMVSTSYPLTYAFPGLTDKQSKSLDTGFPCFVTLFSKYIPLFPILSFRHSFAVISNGVI